MTCMHILTPDLALTYPNHCPTSLGLMMWSCASLMISKQSAGSSVFNMRCEIRFNHIMYLSSSSLHAAQGLLPHIINNSRKGVITDTFLICHDPVHTLPDGASRVEGVEAMCF